jgi:D-amino peptidase
MTCRIGLILLSLAVTGGTALAQPDGKPTKIFIAVDSEGQTGNNEYWARNRKPGDPAFERYRKLLTDDVSAAIAGCFAGGADEVYVKDDGFRSRSIIRDQLDRRATLVPSGGPILHGLDGSFAGVMLVGFHAMEGAKDGVLAHTWSSARRRRYWFNDREGGELFVYATVAGHDHNVPIIMAAGCSGLCREVHDLLGEDVVTVSVKSVRKDGAVDLPPPTITLPKITEAAKRAAERIERAKVFRPTFPIRVRLQLADEKTVDGYIDWRHDNKPDWPGKKAGRNTIEATVTSTRHLTL